MSTAASLGAVLELLRALNWAIRADVPWPTRRGQSFDFVLVGEPGAFALCVTDGDPDGVEDAAAALSELLGIHVRPIVCRSSVSLSAAHPLALFCTPENALDLFIGMAPHEISEEIKTATLLLRDLEVPIPPEPEPEPVPVAVAPSVEEPAKVAKVEDAVAKSEEPKVAPPKVEVPKVVPPKVEVPKVVPPKVEVPKVAPPKVAPPTVDAPPVVERAIAVAASATAPTPPPHQPRIDEPESPTPTASTAAKAAPARPLPAGRHRSERPRRALTPRRTPPPPPESSEAASTLELPTALAAPLGRVRGGDNAGQRFDNNYVYVPEPVSGPGPLRREFRAKAFVKGIVAIVAVVLAAGVAVKLWPQVAGLMHTDVNPSAAFGRTITADSTDYHPKLELTAAVPHKGTSAQGLTSYVVDFSVSNVGSASWPLPATSALVLVDSLGESHALSTISGARGSAWAGSLRPTRSWTGHLTFRIRSNRTPLRLRFVLASNGSESATWMSGN